VRSLGGRRVRRSQPPVEPAVKWVIALAAAFSLAIGWYELLGLHELYRALEYDDGVWFGTSIRMAHGALPYKDFVDDQPPGVSLAMLPLALLSRATGTREAMALARLSVPLVEAVGVVAVGWTLRHRGVLATLIGCGVLAVYPIALIDQRTVMLEPFCATAVLVGLALAFGAEGGPSSTRRLVAAGVCFGLAGTGKAFAILPFAAVVIVLALSRDRRRLAPVLGATAGAFILVCSPFLVAAPGAFVHQVLVTQLVRTQTAWPRLLDRLTSLMGSQPQIVPPPLPGPSERIEALVVTLAVALLVLAAYALAALGRAGQRRRGLGQLDGVALLAALLTLGGLLAPAAYFYHYAAFFGPFLALVLGVAGGHLAGATASTRLHAGRPARRPARSWLAGLTVVVLAVGAAHAWEAVRGSQSKDVASAAVEADLPPGACALTDDPDVLILSDRFQADASGCSPMVDSFGTTISYDQGRPVAAAAQVPRSIAVWLHALQHSNYLVLTLGYGPIRVPWGAPALRQYLDGHFRTVATKPYLILARR
jgi:hypothetical protein